MLINVRDGLDINTDHIVTVVRKTTTHVEPVTQPSRGNAKAIIDFRSRIHKKVHPRSEDAEAFQADLDAMYEKKLHHYNKAMENFVATSVDYEVTMINGLVLRLSSHPKDFIPKELL